MVLKTLRALELSPASENTHKYKIINCILVINYLMENDIDNN